MKSISPVFGGGRCSRLPPLRAPPFISFFAFRSRTWIAGSFFSLAGEPSSISSLFAIGRALLGPRFSGGGIAPSGTLYDGGPNLFVEHNHSVRSRFGFREPYPGGELIGSGIDSQPLVRIERFCYPRKTCLRWDARPLVFSTRLGLLRSSTNGLSAR